MKKNIYLAAVACGAVVGLASCSNEDVPVPAQGDATTFTVKLPADLATRAFGDGTTATDLHIAVYDSLGNALMNDFGSATLGEGCTVNNFSGGSLTTTVTLPLVKNKSYKILFWAQANGAPYSYDVAGKTVTVDYSKAATDAETMDAFYSYESIKADGKLHDVTLTRPFAQINIGTNDLTKASNAGMKVSKAGVSFAAGDLATTLDITNGTAATPTTAATAFTVAALPSGEAFPASGYDYLTMAYVLVPSTADAPKATLSQVSLFLNDDTTAWASFSNVPAQGNFRTNIYGALLTNPEQFNVTINPDWGTPDIEYAVAGDWDSFKSAVDAGNDVSLTSDLTAPADLQTLAVTSPMTIDPGGHSLNLGTTQMTNAVGNSLTIKGEGTVNGTKKMIINSGDLTVSGGTFNASGPLQDDEGLPAKTIWNKEGATCHITGGSFASNGMTIMNNGKMVIDGGTFTSSHDKTTWSYIVYNEGLNFDLTINDGNFTSQGGQGIMINNGGAGKPGGKITINGGRFAAMNGYIANFYWCSDATINGGTFSGGGAIQIGYGTSIVINDGNFLAGNWYPATINLNTSPSMPPCKADIKGGYFYAKKSNYSALYIASGAEMNITGGYYSNIYNMNSTTEFWSPAAGYKINTLNPALQMTISGIDCTFGYQVVAE